MTERIEIRQTAECFAAHRMLWEAAAALARRLSTGTDAGHLLHLGASCMRLAAEQALQSRTERDALRNWRECSLADRQIRVGVYRGLRRNGIDNGTYDDLFRLSKNVGRIREEERQRLRRTLSHQIIV